MAIDEAIHHPMKNVHATVRQCQEGHLDAFDALFIHFRHRVFDLACIILRDEAAAEDAVQETFLSAFEKIEGFRGESSFETWLTAIAVNECRARLRRERVRRSLSLEQLSPRRLLRLSDRQQDLADLVDSRRQRERMWDMVDQLEDRLRLPLILRYRFGLPCGDIALILDLRTSTTYQYLNEGRKRLERTERQAQRSPAALIASLD